jgi:hypothetical protein
VTSRVGSVEAPVEVTDAIRPGVVSLPHGWGHDVAGTRMRVAAERSGVNSNVLSDHQALDPLSGNERAQRHPGHRRPRELSRTAPHDVTMWTTRCCSPRVHMQFAEIHILVPLTPHRALFLECPPSADCGAIHGKEGGYWPHLEVVDGVCLGSSLDLCLAPSRRIVLPPAQV